MKTDVEIRKQLNCKHFRKTSLYIVNPFVVKRKDR